MHILFQYYKFPQYSCIISYVLLKYTCIFLQVCQNRQKWKVDLTKMRTYANNTCIEREFANCDTSYGKDIIEHCKVTILIVKLKECSDFQTLFKKEKERRF